MWFVFLSVEEVEHVVVEIVCHVESAVGAVRQGQQLAGRNAVRIEVDPAHLVTLKVPEHLVVRVLQTRVIPLIHDARKLELDVRRGLEVDVLTKAQQELLELEPGSAHCKHLPTTGGGGGALG
jgi:hypothetical protein